MAGKSEKSASIFDRLKTGAVVIGEEGPESSKPIEPLAAPKSDAGNGTGNAREAGTGNEGDDGDASGLDFGALEPAAFFGDDPGDGDGDGEGYENNPSNAPGSSPRPGAPRGKASPNYGKKASQKANLGFIEKCLFSVHLVGSSLVNDPSWALTEDEAKELAKALGEVQEQYNLVMDPKTEAWLKLVAVAGTIYGPRIVLPIMMKRMVRDSAKEKPSKAAPEPIRSGGTVTPMRQPNESGKGPLGAFTPSQMMPMGFGSGAESE